MLNKNAIWWRQGFVRVQKITDGLVPLKFCKNAFYIFDSSSSWPVFLSPFVIRKGGLCCCHFPRSRFLVNLLQQPLFKLLQWWPLPSGPIQRTLPSLLSETSLMVPDALHNSFWSSSFPDHPLNRGVPQGAILLTVCILNYSCDFDDSLHRNNPPHLYF